MFILGSSISNELGLNALFIALTDIQKVALLNAGRRDIISLYKTKGSDFFKRNTLEGATVLISPYYGIRYVATLSQTGSNDPAPTVLLNMYSAAIVWTRISEFIFDGTLAGAFRTDGGTDLKINDSTDIESFVVISSNVIRLTVNPDCVLTNRRIEINTIPVLS